MGPRNPLAESYSAFGCLACPGGEWTDLVYLRDSDNQCTKVLLAGQPNCFQTVCYYSRTLYAYDFGFTIPAGSIIDGVKAHMIRLSSISLSIKDTVVKLFTGSPVGTNHADTTFWTQFPITITYGASNDTWGYTLTPDSVNSTQFGMAVQAVNRNAMGLSVSASVDNILMTVYYTLGTGIFSQTRSSGHPSVYFNEANNSLKVFSANENIQSVTVLDATGKKIIEAGVVMPNEFTTIDLPFLSQGIYFAVLRTNDNVFTEKIIVTFHQ